MKLKKLFIAASIALCSLGASAQSIDDIRIYINPGHGSWGPDNRHCATIGHNPISTADPDTTDFFESNTNLWKCLELFHRLKQYGFKHDAANALDLSQHLVMSRIENGPYPYNGTAGGSTDKNNAYNRAVSEIAEEVEANNFDMFISVHSNAIDPDGSTTNYLYFIYRTSAGAPGSTCIAMSEKGWNQRIKDRHTQWTHYDNQVGAGNVKIESTTSLGVLKHSIPGFLVEGYFHSYQPARHRAMNPDVCHMEGIDYARGIADYYGVAKESTGDIYGVVRDLNQKFSDDVYTPRAGTDDVYKPLNGVDVTLKQGETVVATYKTDGNYNGAFVFRNLQPGDYTVEFSHADYKPCEPIAVTVKAATTSYPTAFLESTSYEPPKIVYVNYPDSTAGKEAFALAAKYNFTGSTNDAIAELEGKTIRRTIIRDDKAYILALDANNAPFVYIYDIATKAIIKTLGTTAATGDILKISDIALTADGYLVGINKAKQAYGGANNMKGYKWDKDEAGLPDGEVTIWWENNFAGNWSNGIGGESCYYNGTLEDGQFVYTGSNVASPGKIRIIYCTISDGNYVSLIRNNQDESDYMKTGTLGETYNITLSPRADNQWVINSDKKVAVEYQKAPTDESVPTNIGVMSEDALSKTSANESYFKYAGRDLMVAPDVNADGQVQGVKLFDITDGLDKAIEIATNATITPTTYTYASAHGELALTIDDVTDKTTGAEIELFLNVDGKITKFTTANTEQPIFKGEYAYDLSMEGNNGSYTLKFFVTGDAPEANIILTNIETNEETVVPVGAVTAGENTFEISVDEYGSSNMFNWAVQINSNAIPKAYWVFNSATNRPLQSNSRGGVAFINDTESDAFGKIVVSNGYSYGVDVYSATQELLSTTAYTGNSSNAASTFRCAEHDGIVYLTDWSDAYSGIYTFDPANPAPLTQWYNGTRGSGGVFTNATGTAIGGGASGLDFYGEGENAQMFVFCEDYPAKNGNTLVRYDFGGASAWSSAPNKTYPNASAKLNANTNVEIVTTDRGFFAAQVRTAGNNNSGVPAFIFVDYNDNILYNAGSTGIVNGCGGSVAISPDGSKFAVSTPDEGIVIFALSWGDDNVPAFEKLYTLPNSISTGKNNEVLQLDFDIAGNLHAFLSTHGYRSYSLPNDNPTATTAAKKALLLKGTTTGIENIKADVDADNVPATYYNLQGVQVDNPTNGIYIVKRGNKITKEYIR